MIEAGMAVIPSRFKNLDKSIPNILNQVDKLYVHINNYKGDTPYVLHDDKIEISMSEDNKNAFMKMRAMPSSTADYFFTMDDDILYPEDYVERMRKEADKDSGYSVMCVHGSTFKAEKGLKGFINHRRMYSFWDGLAKTTSVMMLGNGTSCYPSRAFLLEDEFKEGLDKAWDIDDVYMMCRLHRKGLNIKCIKRNSKWLRQLPSCNVSLQKKRPSERINKLVGEYDKYIKEACSKLKNIN